MEDTDLHTEEELIQRARQFIDRTNLIKVTINGMRLKRSQMPRMQSEVFDLCFPENAVYDVKAGPTRAVCDGYWVFLKPLTPGKYFVRSMAEVQMLRDDEVTRQFLQDSVYEAIRECLKSNLVFSLNVCHDITVN